MQYTIRKAMQADVPAVAGIYDRILLKEEAGQVTIGWLRGVYPTEQTARAALAADDLFVMEATVLSARRRASIRCRYRNTETPTGAMRTCRKTRLWCCTRWWSTPCALGGGFGTAFVSFYEQYAKAHACRYLRMDTNVINKAARRFYAKLGFYESGVIGCVFNGIPDVKLVCLEKKLDF